MRTPSTIVAACALVPLALCSCEKREAGEQADAVAPVQVAEPSPPVLVDPAPPVVVDDAVVAGSIWTVPPGWKRLEGERPMRVATYVGHDADIEIALSKFPGEAGGLIPNINRWRGQVGLEPIDAVVPHEDVGEFTNGSIRGYTMRLRGSSAHMLGAIIFDPAQDQTWFIKATGTPAQAEAIQREFLDFARSFTREP